MLSDDPEGHVREGRNPTVGPAVPVVAWPPTCDCIAVLRAGRWSIQTRLEATRVGDATVPLSSATQPGVRTSRADGVSHGDLLNDRRTHAIVVAEIERWSTRWSPARAEGPGDDSLRGRPSRRIAPPGGGILRAGVEVEMRCGVADGAVEVARLSAGSAPVRSGH